MFALKIVFIKSTLFWLSNQETAFNKTVGIPQKIPIVVNQSAQDRHYMVTYAMV